MQNLFLREQQRLKLLMLFVATSVLLLAGTIFLLRDGANRWLVLPMTITTALLGVCFCRIDRRNVAAMRSSELEQRDASEGGTQASKVVTGTSRNPGSCCGLDGYTCIYILGIVLGLYFSVIPYAVQLQPMAVPTVAIGNTNPVNQAPTQIRPMPQMPSPITPIQRPNVAPLTVMPSAHPPTVIRPSTPPSGL